MLMLLFLIDVDYIVDLVYVFFLSLSILLLARQEYVVSIFLPLSLPPLLPV